jgi:hypothetical protein
MTTNESYPDRRPDDADDALETNAPESGIARAWDALEQIHDRVAEVNPSASEHDIAAQVGDYVADRLIHDADQAAAEDRITPEGAARLRDDSAEVLLQGGIEDDLSIPLDENPITHVADEGHDALLAEAAKGISREDAEIGTQAAILLGRATERIDRTKLTVQPRHEQYRPQGEADETPSAAESATAKRLLKYNKILEDKYTLQLAELFSPYLRKLTATETALIHGDEKLRKKIAHAIHALGVERDTLDLGDSYEDPFIPADPEIAKRALELEERAIQVNAAFQAEAGQISRATGSLHVPGPVKDAHRIAEKMEREYRGTLGGNETSIDLLASLVKDAVRCRIVIDGDPTTADQAVIETITESGLAIAKDALHHPLIKRSFRDRHTGKPLDIGSGAGYRDTKVTVTVTVEVPTRDGGTTLCEIAIVTPEMAAATVSEHPIYEISRSLEADKRPATATLLSRLEEVQEAFYRDVS